MKDIIINGYSLPNIPWEERKTEGESPLWRYSLNPVTKRNPAKGIARIFNSAVVPFQGGDLSVFFEGSKMMVFLFYTQEKALMALIGIIPVSPSTLWVKTGNRILRFILMIPGW